MKQFQYFPILAVFALFFFACDDVITYDDNYDDGLTPHGPPVISYVSPVTDINDTIDAAAFNQMIVIHGENLSQVQSILFNDVEVDLETIHATNKRITVSVPGTEPNVRPNTITITTSKGSTVHSLRVIYPTLEISGISHEFANAGESIDITGKNFLLYGLNSESAEIKINDQKVEIESISETLIRIKIPTGVVDNSKMTFYSDKMNDLLGGETIELTYRDRGYPLIDLSDAIFDYPSLPVTRFATDGSNPGDPAPLFDDMNFFRIGKIQVEKYSYNFFVNSYLFNLPFGENALLTDMKNNAANYEIRYEMLIPSNAPITEASNQIVIGLKNAPDATMDNDQLYIAAYGEFHTNGRWKTMKFDDPDRYVRSNGTTYFNEKNNVFSIVWTNSTGYPVISPDMSVTNFRFVKRINIVKTPV